MFFDSKFFVDRVLKKLDRETLTKAKLVLNVVKTYQRDYSNHISSPLKLVFSKYADKIDKLNGVNAIVHTEVCKLYDELCDITRETALGKALLLESYNGTIELIVSAMKQDSPVNCFVVLLHGEPGTGKSFYAEALSDYAEDSIDCGLGSGVRRVNIEDLKMTRCLDRFVGEICLIDEVDGMYTTKGNKELMHNFLDDIKKVNSKTVVIMTTNHFDKLENTPLVRPGRVDKILHIGPCTEKDIEAYVSKTKVELSRVTERLEIPYTIAKAGQIVKDLYMQDLLDKLENR
jgi:hypothetical protein